MVISDHRGVSDEVVLERERARRRARRHAELGEDVLHVPRDGVLADHERSPAISRLLFPVATRRSTSSSRGVNPCASAGSALPVSESTDATDPEPRRARRTAPALRRAPARTRPRRRAARHARPTSTRAPARLVRRLELLPRLRRLAKARERGSRVAAGQLDRSRACARPSPPACRSRTRLRSPRARGMRRAPRRRSPTASMISTYAGRRPARRSASVVSPQHATNRGGRRVALSLRKPQQRQPGCGSSPSRLASRYASSASANSPRSRWTSPCR